MKRVLFTCRYPDAVIARAEQHFDVEVREDTTPLKPGQMRAALTLYDGIDAEALRTNFARFLDEVVPTAAELGMRLCVHPDDPPRDILGVPHFFVINRNARMCGAQVSFQG